MSQRQARDGGTTTLSFFRFEGLADKLWAFSQMQFARSPLARLPGIGFYKLFGSGSGESFDPIPNTGVYAILATWPSLDVAQEQVAQAGVFKRYRDHAAESLTVHVGATSAYGLWDGVQPFAVPAGQRSAPDAGSAHEPIGVLTRATLNLRTLPAFWKTVPDISASIAREPALLFKLGLGEVPWVHQVTFSVWENAAAINNFAYKSQFHGPAVTRARELGWFKEELFARFAILAHEGTWDGDVPFAARAQQRAVEELVAEPASV